MLTEKDLALALACTGFVQRAVSLVLSRVFDCRTRLFHTLFNRTVENCHAAFIVLNSQRNNGARIALRRARHRRTAKAAKKFLMVAQLQSDMFEVNEARRAGVVPSFPAAHNK